MNTFDRRRISANVIASIAQVLASSVAFFLLYRYLLDQLGVAQLGVWSLVLATTSVSRIGDLGLSAGVVKFVAQALAQGDARRVVRRVVELLASTGS